MGIVRLALKNPYLIIVLALGIGVVGVTAATRLPTDILPMFKTPAVQVLTFYPGMPAEVMEKDITSRLERWTGQSNGIARQESKSMVGVSIVKDYFREDIDPNTAMSQVTSLAMSDLYYLPPGTIPPMVMPFDPTASIPLCLLTVYSDTHDEKALYDIAYFDLRNRLQGVPGVIAPAVYGGKLRRIMTYVDRDRLQARNLSPLDVAQATQRFNTMIPTGNAKFGDIEYQLNANGMVEKVDDLNSIPIKLDGQAPVFLRDVAQAKDSSTIQTNLVRVNGRRQVYIPIYRQPGANSVQIVEALKKLLPPIVERLPKGVNLAVTFDQSIYIKESISNLEHEALIGGALAILMILLFLRSVRSTVILSLAIPLAILSALIGLYFTGQSLNVMTLGGLALVIGVLVDNGIVVLENTHRHLLMGKPPSQAALDGASEVAMPVLSATITTAVVFFPVIFLTGMGRFLFTPLALTVAFAIAASYALSMTLVPICCAKFFRAHLPEAREARRSLFDRFADRFSTGVVGWAVHHPFVVTAGVLLLFAGSMSLFPAIGTELFPPVDAGQFSIRVRAPSGTRIEETEKLVARVEKTVQDGIPPQELGMVISNIGVLMDWPAAYTPNSGPADAFVLVQLKPDRSRGVQDYVADLRRKLRDEYPGIEFAFETGGMLTAALNSGLPSPIDIQIEGNKLETAAELAQRVQEICRKVPGAEDVRIQQKLDTPQIAIDVDRTRAAFCGLNQQDVVKNVVTAFNSSTNFSPAFWIDQKNGNHYFIGAQYPESAILSLNTLEHVPITGAGSTAPTLLKNVATFRRSTAPAEVQHLNIGRVTDVYVNVSGRDTGAVAADIEEGLERLRADMKKENDAAVAAGKPKPWEGYKVTMRGEVASMKESFASLGFGFGLAAILVYLVMVAQFRSFLDPLIVMFAVPLGLIGVLATLYLTGTTLNIQSFMGVTFMVGIAVATSVLLVEFANRLREERGLSAKEAAVESVRIRLRPILMTSLAATLGLLPMAIGMGRGSEANVPLARAVVGGLASSTVLVLVFVPVLYSLFTRNRSSSKETTAHA
ncbi:MAG: efflux RND transporter permease subunit [Planctomycetes bacterium]|nr:efflux RND transporter permease subunit [Planctomycetota bacterium]